MNTAKKIFFLITGLLLLNSCDKADDDTSQYTIPSTYNFDNVDYSGQEQRIAMLSELKSYMASANTANTVLDADRLQAMFTNNASTAGWQGTYEDSKQIKSKTFEQEQVNFENMLNDLATASQSTTAGQSGQAGVVTSSNGAKNYLLNENGLELGQVIEKGLMGALLYYQATAVYMESGKIDSDNETVEDGRGTEMEHSWDEAFGYFGVPKTFPSDTEPLYFWGDYCNDRDELTGTNQAVMNAFLKGRAAISNKDLTTRDEAIDEARAAWESVIVGTALHYINGSIEDFDDMALRAHQLSEAVGFVYSLQFSPGKQITNNDVNELITLLVGTTDFSTMNVYTAELSDLESARDQLAEHFGYTEIKSQF